MIAIDKKKLVHLPHKLERVIIFALYTKMPLPITIDTSRTTITKNAQTGKVDFNRTSAKTAAESASLSATGSNIKPSSVDCFRRRAKKPSNKSVMTAIDPQIIAYIHCFW